MSLLQKLQASQQKDDNRRPSKNLSVPGGGGGAGRRTSSVVTGMSQGPRASGGGSGPMMTQGPSLIGLLASKRLAKRFASRFHSRRWGSRLSGGLPVQKEPSYRMEPHHKFNASQVEEMLKSLLEERFSRSRYSPKICANMCKIMGDEIKNRVKQMNFDRYKIVSNVLIGQKKDQAIINCSRCAWDEKLDNFASYTFQNEHIFVTATVFGVYTE
ncbi:dynein light chain Tctex-type 5-like [Babylonia areolata]|uniref:dynein light chain Tctex-type 5-like n=1 Tax=Babylonia areolata TaxID=304850 RepID=UPI003FD4C1C4